MVLRNWIEELHKKAEIEGRLHRFTDAQMAQLHREINEPMRWFRIKLAHKQVQSVEDTSRIILNA